VHKITLTGTQSSVPSLYGSVLGMYWA